MPTRLVPTPAKRAPRPPLVLLVGDGEATADALAAALKLRGLGVMSSPAERAAAAAVARAPDLVLLLGDAAQEGGQRVIKTLAGHATTARVPVAVLEDGDAGSLDRRLRALRSGAIAVIERQASVDAMASRIGDLAWRVTDHTTRAAAGVEVTLDELTAVVRKELGLLVPEDVGQSVAAPGREMAEAIQVFVERIRALVKRGDVEGARAALAARTTQMNFDAAMLAELDDGATLALRGARILLVHDDPSRADTLAQELRARGAIVVVSGRSERGLVRGRELDPEVVLLDSGCVNGPGIDVAALLTRDARLRWAAVLVMSWNELWPAGIGVPKMGPLAARVAPHRTAERELAERVIEEAHFELDVARIGPARTLRALALAPHVLGVTAVDDLGQAHVDLANGLIAGATADGLEGLPALAQLIEMNAGVLRIERRRAPSTANILLPVEDALGMAGRENAPDRLSSPPPSATAVGTIPAAVEHPGPPVAELDAPFDGDAAPTLTVTTVPEDDAPAEGLAALLEPESVAPTARMRRQVDTPSFPTPALDATPAKPTPRHATLLGVPPPTAAAAVMATKAERELAALAPTEATPRDAVPIDARPIAAPPIAAPPFAAPPIAAPPIAAPPIAAPPMDAPPIAAPSMDAPPIAAPPVEAPRTSPELAIAPHARGATSTASPLHVRPTPPAPARRSKLPIALAGVALLVAVAAFAAWRFVGPTLLAGRPTTPAVRPTTHPAPPRTPTQVVAPPAPTPNLPTPTPPPISAPTPELIPPTAILPPTATPDLVAVQAAPDAGPANAPALAAAEAQTLATALDSALTENATDPDAESERLTDEAATLADPARAAALLLHAAELSPRNSHPAEALARLYLRTGNAAGAVEWAGKLVALRRRRASVHVLLGDARRAAGDAAGAQQAYQDALALDPANHDATQRLAP